jgi:AAA domain
VNWLSDWQALDDGSIEFPEATVPPLTEEEERLGARTRDHEAPTEPQDGFAGITHADLLETEVPPAHQLVEGLIEKGTLGTLSGLPETYKSFLSLALSLRVASGGRILGRRVLEVGPVGHWWQDDSRENELRRIQAYARRHGFTEPLPVRWHLNEGLMLPNDIPQLRAEIEREKQKLVFFDSLYNFVGGVKLKDEDVAGIFARLKAEVCDPTGCAVCLIDHAPWPTDANSGQRRAYGSVFKAAAIRWGIYIDRTGDTFFVEARGNNLAGLARTAAVWDADRLELRIVEPPAQTDDLAARIEDFLRRNPGAATSVIRAAVSGNDTQIGKRLDSDERFSKVPPKLFGKPSNSICWALTEELPSILSATSAENPAEVGQRLPRETDSTSAAPTFTPEGCKGRADVGSPPLPNGRQTTAEETCRRCGETFRRGSGNKGELCRKCAFKEIRSS